MMQSENLRQRAAVLGLQVFSKRSAIRLGIVTQIWLDVDQRRVMGVSVAERFIPGTPIGIGDTFYMSLENIDLLGPDAILVDDESVLEDVLITERYTTLINNEVVTESGEPLGKVRDFKFDPETGELLFLIIASVGNPIIPATLVSTYELDVNEIIAVGRDRIIVTEGMEDRMTQLSKGLLERLGLGKAPWEDEFDDDYMPPTTTIRDNALSSGTRSSYSPPPQQRPPVYRQEQSWDDGDNWAEERIPVNQPPQRRQAKAEIRPEPSRPIVPTPINDYDDYDDFEDDYPPANKSDFRNETQKQILDAWGETKIPDRTKQRFPEEEFDEI
ncbi:PRC-barrel domain-containing protein [Pseudanabaena sp. FACHB-1277]|uniref:PRC-barrel domain-containing protein n=1 Tax=Pseudanabaena cinerea FACHB-1277 TaxID=2949581 RepID=A0A926Z4T2_9CYAN|nr:PRC-barrel domain-containing protein [Pseudanabaena cinerea]MBD2149526.1 PRC-barrel domain-containing protein [Pseudanabaena cinerea FACHB-1277]